MSTREIVTNMLDILTEDQLQSLMMLIESFTMPNKETIEAIEESERMLNDPNTKKFTSIEELFEDLKS